CRSGVSGVPGGRASHEVGRSGGCATSATGMMVKICGITNREDALAAVEAGASAIGFNFYRESPRYISHTGAAMIGAKIPASVWKVGVFVNESPETIARIVLDAGLDVAQLHGSSDARGVRIWRALSAAEAT